MDYGPDRTDLADRVRHLSGLHVGLLDPDELRDFNAACDAGVAQRDYRGPGGMLGLAKVKFNNSE